MCYRSPILLCQPNLHSNPVGTYREHQYFVTYRRKLDSLNLQLSINGVVNLFGFRKVRCPFRKFLMQEFLLLVPIVRSGLEGPSSWISWARRNEPDQFLISLCPTSKEFCGRKSAVGAPFIDRRAIFVVFPGFTQPFVASDAEGCGRAFSCMSALRLVLKGSSSTHLPQYR